MNKLHKLLNTPRRFEKWLKGCHPNKRIHTGCETNCPIAEFLIANGIKYPIVNPMEIVVYECNDERNHYVSEIICDMVPNAWIENFIVAVDNLGVEKETRTVSPKECLKILDEIKYGHQMVD